MSVSHETEMRAEFEKWQIVKCEWRDNPKHPNGGRYVDDRLEEQWIVWQAAYARGMARMRETLQAIVNCDRTEIIGSARMATPKEIALAALKMLRAAPGAEEEKSHE
jgi:hypothetical protein